VRNLPHNVDVDTPPPSDNPLPWRPYLLPIRGQLTTIFALRRPWHPRARGPAPNCNHDDLNHQSISAEAEYLRLLDILNGRQPNELSFRSDLTILSSILSLLTIMSSTNPQFRHYVPTLSLETKRVSASHSIRERVLSGVLKAVRKPRFSYDMKDSDTWYFQGWSFPSW
jgi:hypothetical protein